MKNLALTADQEEVCHALYYLLLNASCILYVIM